MDKKGKKKTKKRLKLRMKVVGKILLVILVICALFAYINNLDTKNIVIKGNTNIKDVEIIETADIKNYPKIFKLNIKKTENKIKKIDLVENVKIKRNLLGKLTIEIEENDILFYYKYNQKYITDNKKELKDNKEIIGYPTLINFTPNTAFDELVKGLSKIDNNIIKMIDEIEYTPYKNGDAEVIEESFLYTNARFTLHMKDENTVIIDTVNIKRLQNYPKIFTSLKMDETKGILELDTISDKKDEDVETYFFRSYESVAAAEKEKAKKEEEKKKEQGEQ